MDPVQKQALKEVLHLLVDKEEPQVVQDLLSKLPQPYSSIASAIFSGVNPGVVASLDKKVDSI